MSNRLYLEEEDDTVLDEDATSTRLYLDEEDDESPELQDISTRLYLEPEEEQDDVLLDTTAAAPTPAPSVQTTIQAPQGYEYRNVPGFDDKGDPIVRRELVELDAEPAPKPPESDFTYEETSAAFSQAGRDLLDTLTLYDKELHNVFGEEFTVTHVPEYLRPYVRVTGKTVDGILASLGSSERLILSYHTSWLNMFPCPCQPKLIWTLATPRCWLPYVQNWLRVCTHRIPNTTRLHSCHQFVTTVQHIFIC